MSLDLWAAFTVAAMIMLVVPGPTIILVISQAVAHGCRATLPLVLGVVLGDFTAMALSLLGLGAILAASSALFAALKWAGAGYLIWMGIRRWNARSEAVSIAGSGAKPLASRRRLFRSAYVVTALNPKGIIFFVAFLPQFITPQNPMGKQLAILGATFLILAGINAGLYALFAGNIRDHLAGVAARRWFNRGSACALIGAGLITAALRRSG